MLSLFLNENMKIFRRARSWILMVSLIVITAVTLVVVSNLASSTSKQAGGDWKQGVQLQIKSDEAQLASPQTPKHMRASIQAEVKADQYRLAHNVPPTAKTLWGDVLTASNLIAVVTIFTVIVAADSVAGEFSGGTIKMLLIRPFTRSQVLLAKYLSICIFSLLLLAILLVTAFGASGVLAGFHDVGTPYVYAAQDGSIHEVNIVRHVLATYGFQCVQLIMIVTMAFMISTVFRSSSLAIGLSLGVMFIGSAIAAVLTSFSWAKYYLFENTDLTHYLNGSPMIAGMTLSFSITVLIVYFIIFIASSWIVFNRRDVAA